MTNFIKQNESQKINLFFLLDIHISYETCYSVKQISK